MGGRGGGGRRGIHEVQNDSTQFVSECREGKKNPKNSAIGMTSVMESPCFAPLAPSPHW